MARAPHPSRALVVVVATSLAAVLVLTSTVSAAPAANPAQATTTTTTTAPTTTTTTAPTTTTTAPTTTTTAPRTTTTTAPTTTTTAAASSSDDGNTVGWVLLIVGGLVAVAFLVGLFLVERKRRGASRDWLLRARSASQESRALLDLLLVEAAGPSSGADHAAAVAAAEPRLVRLRSQLGDLAGTAPDHKRAAALSDLRLSLESLADAVATRTAALDTPGSTADHQAETSAVVAQRASAFSVAAGRFGALVGDSPTPQAR